MEPTIYIGYDSREAIVYDVCKFSIERRASKPVNIQPIDVAKLRRRGLYWKDKDPLSSTEFTYSRYLAPYLNNFVGCAMFVDCDFLFLADVWELLEHVNEAGVVITKWRYYPDGSVQVMIGLSIRDIELR